jgi:NAD(P)-dependent dehydrogenase (short-subunit alcohol dehydrogenase family)
VRILITGAAGSVGTALAPVLEQAGHEVIATDIQELDVTSVFVVQNKLHAWRPDLIYHLAGAKHAPEGEQHPAMVTRVNALGTDNIVRSAGGAKVILASTCKAGDPETAYGASKLIAERIVLNARRRRRPVLQRAGDGRERVQVVGADAVSGADPFTIVGATSCRSGGCGLLVAAQQYPQGRYAPEPGQSVHMRDVAEPVPGP